MGYVIVKGDFDPQTALGRLRDSLPAALVPRLAEVEDLPTRTSGKIDRDALPWPLPGAEAPSEVPADLHGTQGWIAEQWLAVLGAIVTSDRDDFFDLGGGSLTAAQMVSRLRTRFPEVAMGDIYEQPTVGRLGEFLDQLTEAGPANDREVPAVPRKSLDPTTPWKPRK